MAETRTPAVKTNSSPLTALIAAVLAAGVTFVALKSGIPGRFARPAGESSSTGQHAPPPPSPAAQPPQVQPQPVQPQAIQPGVQALQPPPSGAMQVGTPAPCCPTDCARAAGSPPPAASATTCPPASDPDAPAPATAAAAETQAPEAIATVPATNRIGSIADLIGLTIADVVQDANALSSGVVTLGAIVTNVSPGGMGQKVGLVKGDRIVAVGTTHVMSTLHFFYLLAQQPAAEPARLTLVRQGRAVQLDWPSPPSPKR